jgi:hypothetical protein
MAILWRTNAAVRANQPSRMFEKPLKARFRRAAGTVCAKVGCVEPACGEFAQAEVRSWRKPLLRSCAIVNQEKTYRYNKKI